MTLTLGKLSLTRVLDADIPAILSLSKQIWLPTFAPLFSQAELRSLYAGMYSTHKLSAWLADENHEMYVISGNGEHIGYFALEFHTAALRLDKIYIDPKLQGLGVGSKILAILEKRARKMQLPKIHLNVNRRNQAAVSFYLKSGFRIEKSIDIAGPNGFIYDDFIMSKRIT